MKLGSPAAMSKEPGGPADAPGHVGMSVSELESENERLLAERDELSEEVESVHELLDAHYGLSVRETSMECLKPRVLELIRKTALLETHLRACLHAIRFEFQMNGVVADLHKTLIAAEAALMDSTSGAGWSSAARFAREALAQHSKSK